MPTGAFASVTVIGDRGARTLAVAGARGFTVTAQAVPEPSVTVTAELTSDAAAMRAESVWPELRDKLVMTPLLLAADLSAAADRARLTREGRKLRLDVSLSEAELLRLLEAVATFFGSAP